MIDKQVKQIVKKLAVNDYIMENMFCQPKGMLGRIGGQLMSRDRWLPAWILDLLEIDPSDSVLEVGSGPGLGLHLLRPGLTREKWPALTHLRQCSRWHSVEIVL